jgi:hypothetical protein
MWHKSSVSNRKTADKDTAVRYGSLQGTGLGWVPTLINFPKDFFWHASRAHHNVMWLFAVTWKSLL